MPTAAWNTRWAKGLRRFKRGDQDGHYGDHWGDPTLTGLRYRWHRDKPFLQEAEEWNGFSDMNAPKMEALLAGRGSEVVEHDRALLDHSNVVVIRKPAA